MMDRESLRSTLADLLDQEMGQPFDLSDDAMDLRTGLGLDSVDVVGLVMRVERRFRIRLGMEELLEVRTVGDMLNLIVDRLAAHGAGSDDSESAAA